MNEEDKNNINEHSEEGFVDGFSRYVLAGKIKDCDSWQELETKIDDGEKESLLPEIKFFNYSLLVEQAVSSLISFLYKNGKVKEESFKNFLGEKVKRFRKKDDIDEAIKILDDETDGKDERLTSPRLLYYVCGIGYGDLISIVRDLTIEFPNKQELIDELNIFNTSRNNMIHQILSSAVDTKKDIEKGIVASKELLKLAAKIGNV